MFIRFKRLPNKFTNCWLMIFIYLLIYLFFIWSLLQLSQNWYTGSDAFHNNQLWVVCQSEGGSDKGGSIKQEYVTEPGSMSTLFVLWFSLPERQNVCTAGLRQITSLFTLHERHIFAFFLDSKVEVFKKGSFQSPKFLVFLWVTIRIEAQLLKQWPAVYEQDKVYFILTR